MDRTNIAYWLTTGAFCLFLGFSGASHTMHAEFIVESMTAMGYPLNFMTIIGIFKLLGVATLLAPGLPLLKEWAYAGFTFNLIGATVSHFANGDELSHSITPLVVLGVGAASYALRPASRRIAESVSFGTAAANGA